MILDNTENLDEPVYRFTCPNCGSEPAVDEPVREDLIDTGCYVCGQLADESNFLPIEKI